MSDLYVNADELLNLSATLSQRVTTMEMYIEQFSRALQLLASRWEGEAERAAFESAMQTLQQLVKTAEALANAKALVDSAVETYNATEEAVGALWSLGGTQHVQSRRSPPSHNGDNREQSPL